MHGFRSMKFLFLFALPILFLSACTQLQLASVDGSAPAADPSPTLESVGSPTPDPILDGIKFMLEAGPHASQFSCVDCHGTQTEEAGKQLIWFNGMSGQAESVGTPTELCLKCHPDEVASNTTGSDTQPVHGNFGCTNCHNAHSTQAGCAQSSCHVNVQSTISAQIDRPLGHTGTGDPSTHMCGGEACHSTATQVASAPIYHQPVHRNVPCYVCHDATGMAVARTDDQAWFTVNQAVDGASDGQKPVVSHTIDRSVNCLKCHYSGNPWSLIEVIPDDWVQ